MQHPGALVRAIVPQSLQDPRPGSPLGRDVGVVLSRDGRDRCGGDAEGDLEDPLAVRLLPTGQEPAHDRPFTGQGHGHPALFFIAHAFECTSLRERRLL